MGTFRGNWEKNLILIWMRSLRYFGKWIASCLPFANYDRRFGMLKNEIPGFGFVRAEHLVSDFTGTLSRDGKLLAGIEERLQKISEILKIHIVTSDTFGLARSELMAVKCTLNILSGVDHDLQKEDYVKKLGPEKVSAIGNRKMTAK